MRTRFIFCIAVALATALGNVFAQTPSATPELDPTGNTGALKAQIQTGGSYDAHSGNATRTVTDLSVPGALGVYGLEFTRYFNSLQMNYDDGAGAYEVASGFGWSPFGHSWQWSASFEPIYPDATLGTGGEGGGPGEQDTNIFKSAINILFPDGHTTQFKIARVGHGEWMVPASYPQFGPPYTAAEREEFSKGGAGVHDHLCNMNEYATDFYLCLADGGSVHFVNMVATEVFDPHGLRTGLSYDANGNLEYIEQDGGRFLKINWSYISGGGWVVTSVQGGRGPNRTNITHTVNYEYANMGESSTSALVLQHVAYPDEPAPGQTTRSTYSYGTACGDGTAPCPDPEAFGIMLRYADDPHFAGPMTIIRYEYRGERCPKVVGNPLSHRDYFRAQPFAIAAEKGPNGVAVSTFQISCDYGRRTEFNGLGGTRVFHFGLSAGTSPDGENLAGKGYRLGRMTDFVSGAPSASSPAHKQNYLSGHPYHIWDARDIKTEAITSGDDDSGEPAIINHAGGGSSLFNRTAPGNSAPLDPGQGMHNPYNHWLFSKTDELGHVTTYTRDARRRVTRIDYHGPSFEEFTYNELNQIVTHTLPSGTVEHYDYYPPGNASARLLFRQWNDVDGEVNATIYTYDAVGRVQTVSQPWSRAKGATFSVWLTYNARHQVISEKYPATESGADPFKTYEYDAHGNCIRITDELGHQSQYEYDDFRRCKKYIEPLNAPAWDGQGTVSERRWDWVYDRYVDGVGLRDALSHTKNEWRVQVEPVFNEAGERRVTARWHDVENRVVFESSGWRLASNAAFGDWYSGPDTENHYFQYDANGKKSWFKDPQGRETTYEYDVRNRLWKTNETVNTIPRTTETLYDYAGNKTRVNFPAEAAGQRNQQWLDYDAFGQPGRFIDERGNTTTLTYWWGPMKKLRTVTTTRTKDGGGVEDQVTTFMNDGLGRPLQTLFPDESHEDSAYLYGQLKSWRTRKGQTKYIKYDARGREDSHSWSDENGNCSPATDTAETPCVDRDWDAASRLTKIENRVSKIDYIYDAAAQVVTERDTITGADGTAQLTYYRYPDGSVAQLGYPNNVWVRRDYTARGQLERVSDSATGWKMAVEYAYLDDGKVAYNVYGDNTRTDYQYDGRGFMSSFRTYIPSSNQEVYRRNYFRDERDRITIIQRGTNNQASAMENGHGDRFRYDAEGQMVEAWYDAPNPVSTGYGNVRYELFNYDQLGNRQGWACLGRLGWQQFSRKDNKLNQYSMWSPFSIIKQDEDIGAPWGTPQHANGVTMQEGNITAGYNALNQMVMVNTAGLGSNWMFFGYDPLGRRVQQWVGSLNPNPGNPPNYVPPIGNSPGTFFYYDGWNLVQEGPAFNSASRNYVHGARVDEIVKQITPDNWYERYFHYEGRGHCAFQTDTWGNIIEQYDYDAFGQPYFFYASGNPMTVNGQPGSLWGNRFLFTGREYLADATFPDLRLYDFRNRMYQPELGRFMSPDPKHFAAGDYNLYRYCHNDPINKSDPTGLESYSWVRALVPGAIEFDSAVDNFRAGNYGTGAALTVASFGQAAMAIYTIGASQRVNAPLQSARATLAAQGTVTTGAAQSSRITLQEGEVFLSVVTKEGQVLGRASAGTSHKVLVQRLFGDKGLPAGATAVTVSKMEGEVAVLTSKTFHQTQNYASKIVTEAVKQKYQ